MVCAKFPLAAIELIESAAVPLFFSVTALLALVVATTWLPKARFAEVAAAVLASGEAETQLVGGWYGRFLHRPAEDFGLRTWLNCCKALLTNRRTTFLQLVWLP